VIKEHSALKHFKLITKKYRGCIESMLEARANNKFESWQFLSETEIVDILLSKSSELSEDKYHEVFADMAIATWGITKGIYRFDQDSFNAVIDTEQNDKIPKDILLKSPEWCIYIESPNLALYEREIKGFFVYILGNENPEYLLIVGDYGNNKCEICALSFAKDNVSEMLYDVLQKYREHEKFTVLVSELNKIVSLIIFICTQQQEINGTPKNPVARKTKLGYRVDVRDTLQVWDVGQRIGTAIRLSEKQKKSHLVDHDIGRNMPRPHIRRAHWHGYWVGKGRSDYKLNWVAPALINISDDIPAVIHKVKK
jgi:hypothetical protein